VCVCVCVCVCSLSYPAFNTHAPYCHLWPVRLCSIYSHNLINNTVFGKQTLNIKMCVVILSTAFVWNVSYSKNNSARYDENCKLVNEGETN
jgi:hypothetical protein